MRDPHTSVYLIHRQSTYQIILFLQNWICILISKILVHPTGSNAEAKKTEIWNFMGGHPPFYMLNLLMIYRHPAELAEVIQNCASVISRQTLLSKNYVPAVLLWCLTLQFTSDACEKSSSEGHQLRLREATQSGSLLTLPWVIPWSLCHRS